MNPQQLAPATDPKQQIVQHIKGANNVLVTVSSNPSVDQLAAAIGTTLVLNKLNKHATAIFSGAIPSTIEFLKPEKTFEKTTDSLRDFIIALDKSKADKLRYKVEDKYVKIFITPYRTTIGDKDLEFSQGDYNVDVVLALGVKKKDDLDQAIVNHGRILHDAVVISINHQAGADIGVINLNVPEASSLSEIMVELCDLLKDQQATLFDEQISTAFLTGIVAETKRFSNAKTTPGTMSVAAKLMNSGANQQLIATKLEEPKPILPQPPKPVPASLAVPSAQPPAGPPPRHDKPEPPAQPAVKPTPIKPPPSDGTLKIEHESKPEVDLNTDILEEDQEDIDKIHIDDQGELKRIAELEAEKKEHSTAASTGDSRKLMESPPALGGKLSANTEQERLDPSSDPLSQPKSESPILNRKAPDLSPVSPNGQTLSAIEQSVDSPHLGDNPQITGIKTGGSLGGQYPAQLVKNDTTLPPDKTAGSAEPGAPPPVPPPIPLASPPPTDNNLSDPNSGVPL